MTHPRDYDYRHPTLSADLVMKGGITSGVVYPHAACELAQTYRFCSIGGTSAGAIAAALTAAAEYGRQTGHPEGFAKLAELPDWLGEDRHLLRTFQAQAPTRRLFAVLNAGIGVKQRAPRVLGAALRHYPLSAALGAAPGLAATRLAASDGGGVRLAAPVVVALGGAVAGLGVSLYRAVTRGLPENLFGLCTGMEGAGATDHPAVTPWLNEQINEFANVKGPLTFGDLEKVEVKFRMVTTSLSNGRPFRLPFADQEREFFFDPDEMRRLFPKEVVDWMIAKPGKIAGDDVEYAELVRKLVFPLRPLPDADELPVIVATRMSLSFPGLISAVPLWAIDGTRPANIAARKAWQDWLEPRRAQWPALRDADPATWAGAPRQSLGPEHCWFSDGGIVSNFPVHFFDSPLPRRPTFGINLRPFPQDKKKSDVDQCENVWLPPRDDVDVADWWYPRWEEKGYKPVAGFARAILDTMQNWNDNTQIQVPGYRDRVVHVNHTKDEGGMNLNMEKGEVAALASRGRCAGEKLAERFSRPPEAGKPSWDSHRWLRFRSTLGLVEKMLEQMGVSWNTPPAGAIETMYPDLIGRGLHDPPTNYPWADEEQREQATTETGYLLSLIESFDKGGDVFDKGTPEPQPELRFMPHW